VLYRASRYLTAAGMLVAARQVQRRRAAIGEMTAASGSAALTI
jgi:hypothetical protein